jgi:hypothetical protein
MISGLAQVAHHQTTGCGLSLAVRTADGSGAGTSDKASHNNDARAGWSSYCCPNRIHREMGDEVVFGAVSLNRHSKALCYAAVMLSVLVRKRQIPNSAKKLAGPISVRCRTRFQMLSLCLLACAVRSEHSLNMCRIVRGCMPYFRHDPQQTGTGAVRMPPAASSVVGSSCSPSSETAGCPRLPPDRQHNC